MALTYDVIDADGHRYGVARRRRGYEMVGRPRTRWTFRFPYNRLSTACWQRHCEIVEIDMMFVVGVRRSNKTRALIRKIFSGRYGRRPTDARHDWRQCYREAEG